MLEHHLSLIACPDCGGSLRLVGADAGESGGLECAACRILFPIADGMPVLLPRSARNHDFEAPLVEALGATTESLRESFEKTMELLSRFRGVKSWEWEDEEFWSRQYRERQGKGRGWPMRLWQRELLVDELLRTDSLANKTILDVGCGGGNNFQVLIEPHCDESTTYVAADVSLDGLRLNRHRNPHENSLYVVCSADRLPFRPDTIDVLCFFGILHHTERKAATLAQNLDLLRESGYVLLHEALERSKGRPSFLAASEETSAHEETIEQSQLDSVLREVPLRVARSRFCHTLTMAVLKRILVRYARGRRAFDLATSADVASMHMLGWLIPQFRPAEVLMLLQKDTAR